MITLASDCLLFEMATRREHPVLGRHGLAWSWRAARRELFDPEFVHHATKAVFHYFKHELGRQTVTAGEFAGALEKVLRGFAVTAQAASHPTPPRACWSPICAGWPMNPARAASFSSFRACAPNCSGTCSRPRACCAFAGCAAASSSSPARGAGAGAARRLEGEIVDYLRQCLSAESGPVEFALLVE